MMLIFKKLGLYIYATLKLFFQVSKTWIWREYFAYKTNKKQWTHAWEITKNLFVKCLYPSFKVILVYSYVIIDEIYEKSRLEKFVLSAIYMLIFLLRYLITELAYVYTVFADKHEKYQYSFYMHVCFWIVLGFALRLLFM